MTQPSPSPETSPRNAPRRVASRKPDGIEQDGVKTTIRVLGKSYELTDKQLEEAARRVVADGAHKPRAGSDDGSAPYMETGLRYTIDDGTKPRTGGIAAEQLRAIVERIEKLDEEKAGIASDIRDIYAEAKGNGLCPKTIRKIIALRKQNASERDEAEALLDTYKRALGIGPLFDE